MSNDIGDQFNRDVLGTVSASKAQIDVPEEFKHEKRWSHFLGQGAKVGSSMRMTHHEDAETVFG